MVEWSNAQCYGLRATCIISAAWRINNNVNLNGWTFFLVFFQTIFCRLGSMLKGRLSMLILCNFIPAIVQWTYSLTIDQMFLFTIQRINNPLNLTIVPKAPVTICRYIGTLRSVVCGRIWGDCVNCIDTSNQSKYSIDRAHIVSEALRTTINAQSTESRCLRNGQRSCHSKSTSKDRNDFPLLFYSIIYHLFMYFAGISVLLSYFSKPVTVWQIQCSTKSPVRRHRV